MSATAPTTRQPLLRTDRLSVKFGSQRVLRDLSIEVPRGQTLAIIGESGCGKTVFLKTLLGLQRPTHGTVYFDGLDLAKLSEAELTRQRERIGFVFQQAALFDSLSIEENVSFSLRQHASKSTEEMRQIVGSLLAEVGLPKEVAKKYPAELSGGMRKRVGLARALALEPELILYDEPTTGLDPIMSDVINELILGTRRRHPVTSVMVTHDMTSVRKVADRVVMLYPLARLEKHESQILYDGPPDQIEASRDPRVVQFVRGEARERIVEMQLEMQQTGASSWTNAGNSIGSA